MAKPFGVFTTENGVSLEHYIGMPKLHEDMDFAGCHQVLKDIVFPAVSALARTSGDRVSPVEPGAISFRSIFTERTEGRFVGVSISVPVDVIGNLKGFRRDGELPSVFEIALVGCNGLITRDEKDLGYYSVQRFASIGELLDEYTRLWMVSFNN